jgi:hypothetical protein
MEGNGSWKTKLWCCAQVIVFYIVVVHIFCVYQLRDLGRKSLVCNFLEMFSCVEHHKHNTGKQEMGNSHFVSYKLKHWENCNCTYDMGYFIENTRNITYYMQRSENLSYLKKLFIAFTYFTLSTQKRKNYIQLCREIWNVFVFVHILLLKESNFKRKFICWTQNM